MTPHRLTALTACLLWCAMAPLRAAPYVPPNDQTIVATVRTQIAQGEGSDAERTLRHLRARWLATKATGGAATVSIPNPRTLNAATAYARAAIEQARREGDPRWLGAAQAALAPWWKQDAPPSRVRLLRAIILQSQHDFDAALRDLDALVRDAQAPLAARAQARLTRAGVLQVRGAWQAAASDCQALTQTVPVESEACLIELSSLRGDASAARLALQQLSQRAGPHHHAWLALMRAELAERMGRLEEARSLYKQALQTAPDTYTLGAYADLLLDQGRLQDVVTLLSPYQQVDGLLLRLAIAWRALDAPQTMGAIASLQARFDAARLRGERVHLREEARFELLLKRRADRALSLAQANWAVQKEPADARILMDAARLAARPDVAAQLAQWLRAQGLVDVRLARLNNERVTS